MTDASASSHVHPGVTIVCPCCGKPSSSIKEFTLVKFMLFLYVAASWQRADITACSSCMRRQIAKFAVINIIPMNLAYLAFGPIYLVQFLRTFAKGHSSSVLLRVQRGF